MIDYPHLAQKLFNTPLAILPAKAEVVMAALADRFGVAKLFRPSGEAIELHADLNLDWDEREVMRPYQVVEGVAVIPIQGTLVQKLGTLQPYSGMTGYDGIRANLSLALEDDDVRAIAFDIDSGGGEVAGCFDLVDEIHAARGEKPMAALLSESAYSAAYAIASAVDPGRIYVPRTGGVGSVGVICMHVDLTRALKKGGVNVTLITYGAHKGDGSPYRPLEDAALARFQADVDLMGELFVDTVARNRGLAASAVKGTEAGCFMGASGAQIGFADKVMSPNHAFRTLLAELG